MNKFDPQDAQITAYVFDELDTAERAAFETELASSPELQQAVEQTRTVLSVLEAEIAAQPNESLSKEQQAKIDAAIAESGRQTPPQPPLAKPPASPTPASQPQKAQPKVTPARGGRGRLWAAIAIVEAAALAVGGVIVFSGGPSYDRSPVAVMDSPAAGMSSKEESFDESSVAGDEGMGMGSSQDDGIAAPGGKFGSGPARTESGVQETTAPAESVRGGLAGPPTTSTPKVATANSGLADPQRRSLPAAPGGSAPPRATKPTSRSVSSNSLAGAAPSPEPSASRQPGAPTRVARGPGAPSPAGDHPYDLPTGGQPQTKSVSDGYGGGGLGVGGAPGLGFAGGAPGGLASNKPSPSGFDSRPVFEAKNLGSVPFGRGSGIGGGKPLDDGGLGFGDQGSGPGQGGDQYERIVENDFLSPWDSPYSTFSIDVDTAAYSKVRMYLNQNQLPRPDAVRIEELINYFPYAYEPPSSDESAPPFAARMSLSECPWNPNHRLVRIGVKGQEIEPDQRPSSNLVFLIDVSGSMGRANKLPLLLEGMKMLVEQLNENDTVSIAVYAGSAGLVLEPTGGEQQQTIIDSLSRLKAGGSTNGGAGIKLAYKTALDNFIEGGVNRVILCTDGDFNVGVTGNDELVRLAEKNAKDGVFLSVLGFGMGNHNDLMLEKVSNKGNGNYAFIDTVSEARKVLVDEMSSTLVTIAKDVKIQVEFNPERVAAYRLIGYENRILAAEDFNDDTKDAGEIGAGHAVTALYEIVPKGAEEKPELSEVDSLKYQRPRKLTKEAGADELLTLKMRYKKPDGDTSTKVEFPLKDKVIKFGEADIDFRFTAAVASFGMLLRGSQFQGDASFDAVLEIASEAAKGDEVGYRTEFLELVKKARMLSGK